MNEELKQELDLEIVELGDAKEETKGIKGGTLVEENPLNPKYRLS